MVAVETVSQQARTCCSLAALLVKELSGLRNALVHRVVVLHEGMDLLNGQVDEHTSDLGGKIRSANLLHEGEDA